MVWLIRSSSVSRDPAECFLFGNGRATVQQQPKRFESVNYECEASSQASTNINTSVDVITVCQKVLYTIPSFPVITVELRLVKANLIDESTNHFRVFMREDEELEDRIPANIEMIETCTIDVSPSSLSHTHTHTQSHPLFSGL